MKELILDAVALGYKPLFYTKRGTINAMAKKLEKFAIGHCEPLELYLLQIWLMEAKGIYLTIIDYYGEKVDYDTWKFIGWKNSINVIEKGTAMLFADDEDNTPYKTYEEALMQGIKEAVKLVEN